MVHRLPVFNRHSCRFVASSDIKFLFFLTISISSSHFTSHLPRHLPPGNQVIIRLAHLLSSMPTKVKVKGKVCPITGHEGPEVE